MLFYFKHKKAPMFATLKRTWTMIDGSTVDHKRVEVAPGRHELERIPNPYGFGDRWLVLKGTKVGRSEASWRDWTKGGSDGKAAPVDHGDFEIIIED